MFGNDSLWLKVSSESSPGSKSSDMVVNIPDMK